MCNGTWVCFPCRATVRRPSWRHATDVRPWLIGSTSVGRVRCPHCAKLCQFIGPTIKVPPKRDARAWRRFQERIVRLGIEALDERYKKSVRRRHELEKRIVELKTRPQSVGMRRLIAKVQEELRDDAS